MLRYLSEVFFKINGQHDQENTVTAFMPIATVHVHNEKGGQHR